MVKRILFSLLMVSSSVMIAEMYDFEGDVSFNKPYMFVSLGHNCWQAQATRVKEGLESISLAEDECVSNDHESGKTRAHGLRDAAFPFDWLTIYDVNKLILCLDERFKYFNDESCFVREARQIDLENVRYGCRFTHDWPYSGMHLDGERHKGQLDYIKQKYERRIARFEGLKNYKGKVFFMRSFAYGSDYQNDSTLKLRDALRRFFPDLNFTLVIINHSSDSIFKAGNIEGVKEYFRSDLTDFGAYSSIFNDLLKHEQLR
jgi:hypothetical protein